MCYDYDKISRKINKFRQDKGEGAMLDFDRELEKFKPMMNIDHIEEQLKQETLEDMIDILKSFGTSLNEAWQSRKEG